MKKSNLKKLATSLALLTSLLLFGCVQTNTAENMDNTMNTMDESAGMMKKTEMKESMETTNDTKMEKPMETMKSETPGSSMGKTEDKMMQSDKQDMMK